MWEAEPKVSGRGSRSNSHSHAGKKMANVVVFRSLSDLNKKIEDIEVSDKVKFVRQASTKNFSDDGVYSACTMHCGGDK